MSNCDENPVDCYNLLCVLLQTLKESPSRQSKLTLCNNDFPKTEAEPRTEDERHGFRVPEDKESTDRAPMVYLPLKYFGLPDLRTAAAAQAAADLT